MLAQALLAIAGGVLGSAVTIAVLALWRRVWGTFVRARWRVAP